jgi:hypothetical protein
MITKRCPGALPLGLALALLVQASRADEVIWRPVTKPVPPAAKLDRPIPTASLGRPVPLTDTGLSSPTATVTTASYGSAAAASERGAIVRAQAPDVPPPGSGPPPVPPPTTAYQPDTGFGAPVSQEGFWGRCREFFGFDAGTQGFMQCDHAFDVLCSPVSNPFFFEDPRSLTEVRPLFMYQSVPNNNPAFHGGSAYFFGTQARIALNQQWSIVLNELGFVSLQPKNGDDQVSSSTGFAELRLGPKWTFCRHDNTGFIAATGLTFEIPVGSNKVFQNTGTLGLDPYLTVAKNFGRLPNSWGSFNFMGEVGYSLAVDNQRAQFIHSSVHLDYDVANLHHFYPLVELNWFYYTTGGHRTDFGFEGADLVNFGSSNLVNRSYVSLALGMRYKFSESCQLGGAVEFPISKEKGINDFRITLDAIFRF